MTTAMHLREQRNVRARRFYRGSGHRGMPVDRAPGAAKRLDPDPHRGSWRSRRTSLIWMVAWEVVRRLPEPVAFSLATFGGKVAHTCARGLRTRVRRNLARVVDNERLDDTVAAAFDSYARYWVEAFRAADVPIEEVHARTTTAGFGHLDAVLEEGNGVIVLLAHHGSWDMAAQWAESHGYHLAVVAEVLRPRQLFERFVALRERIGLEVVPLARRAQVGDQAQSSVTRRLSDVLEANHLVGLLTDRDMSGRAPQATFFGAGTAIPMGAAVLACRRGAPIVPITMMQRPRRRWHLQILPPIRSRGRAVADVHREVVAALEDIIRLDPAQWHAFQPIWDETPPV
jgi:KDO2-lipid IV(A) lauroyltransferase